MLVAQRDGKLAGCLYGRRVERPVLRMQMPVFELGTKFVADPLLAPEDEVATLRRLIEALQDSQRECVMWVFPRLSAASFDLLSRAANERGLLWEWQWSRYAYWFDTTIEVDDFLARLDGKMRRELNRRNRRLVQDHAAEFSREEGLDEEVALERFETFAGLEDSGWKGTSGTSIRRRQGYEPYFRELVQSASHAGHLVWYTLRADGRPIAMYLAMRTHNTLWTPKIGYDERYSEHAPGMLLKHHILLECIANDAIHRLDNISAAPWARQWKPTISTFKSMNLFSRGARSTLMYRARAAKRLAGQLLGRPEVGPGPDDRPYL